MFFFFFICRILLVVARAYLGGKGPSPHWLYTRRRETFYWMLHWLFTTS